MCNCCTGRERYAQALIHSLGELRVRIGDVQGFLAFVGLAVVGLNPFTGKVSEDKGVSIGGHLF